MLLLLCSLIATVPDKDQPAKLEVGFKVPFTTWQLLPGPYWVIAAGANNGSQPGTYDWAIVSGGEPNERTEEGLCTTGSGFKVSVLGPLCCMLGNLFEAVSGVAGTDQARAASNCACVQPHQKLLCILCAPAAVSLAELPGTPALQVNGVGLWLFSRVPQDPENTELMLQTLKDIGVDTSDVLSVQQEGCLYEGAD